MKRVEAAVTNAPWWDPDVDKEKGDEGTARASSMLHHVSALETVQRDVHNQNLWNAQLYSNRELAHFDWGTGGFQRASLAPVSSLGENLVLQVVDTLVNQVGKNRPKIKPVTHGASLHLRNQAKLLDKWLYGEWVRLKVHRQGKRVFRDAGIFGFGAFLVHVSEGSLEVERVFPDEVILDQQAVVATGQVREVFRRRVLPAEVVAAVFDIEVDELKDAAVDSDSYTDYRTVGPNYVVVAEGWRAATSQEPGRYMAAVRGLPPLVDKAWDHEWLPWVFLHYQDPASGFYGPGAVEIALPYQIRLNEINEVIRDAQDLMGRPRLLVAEGSRVSPLEIDNLVARIVRYTGIKPEAVTWPAIAPELYNERERVVRTCFEQFGMGQLVAQARPTPGMRFDSAPGIREATGLTESNLTDLVQRYEEMYQELGETIVRVMRAFGPKKGEDGGTTTWIGMTGTKLARERLHWADLDLDENAYTLTLEAASVFPMTPAARRDQLEDWRQRGDISEERYLQLLANPDLDAETSLLSAAADDIDRVIELLERGDYEDPIEEQDLVRGVQRVTLAMLALRRYDEYAEGKLYYQEDNMSKWLAAAYAILQRGKEPPSEPATTAPIGAPMPGPAQMPMAPAQGMMPMQGPMPVA